MYSVYDMWCTLHSRWSMFSSHSQSDNISVTLKSGMPYVLIVGIKTLAWQGSKKFIIMVCTLRARVYGVHMTISWFVYIELDMSLNGSSDFDLERITNVRYLCITYDWPKLYTHSHIACAHHAYTPVKMMKLTHASFGAQPLARDKDPPWHGGL